MATSVSGLSAVPMTVFLILVDSFYFGYLTVSEILEKQIYLEHNFVVTPYNFIQYNAYTSNLANHGLHPRATHLLFNVPLLYNVLGVAAILSTFNWIYRWVFLVYGDFFVFIFDTFVITMGGNNFGAELSSDCTVADKGTGWRLKLGLFGGGIKYGKRFKNSILFHIV